MFQVIYEERKEWPENGPLLIEAPAICTEILVSPDMARRRVNRYLVTYVSMTTHATNPVLVFDGRRSVWRLSINMRLPEFGHVATLGSIDVDAVTQEIIPLPATQIRTIQDQANDIITRLTPAAKQADCLVVCAAMVLTYLHVPARYERLVRTLQTEDHGTVFSNLHYLIR